jgi:uncharacterized protein YcbK (DUF882 family)
MILSRRGMLKAASVMAVAAAVPAVALWPRPSRAFSETAARRIALKNLHTGERLDIEYFRDGAYVNDALVAIEVLLRDFRNGEQHAIDPKLMDYLVDVADSLGAQPAFSVISGYRSPQTNERLHELSSGVSQHSLHMQGQAIDVRMPNVDCALLAARAEGLKRGGVGYYRASNFVHLDTGRFRTWRG